MVKAVNIAAIEKTTNTAWPQWCTYLDRANAADVPHGQIVKIIKERGSVSAWWAQSVAIACEQHIGRRKPGQRSNGSFTASLTRTFDEWPEKVFAAWQLRLRDQARFGGRHLQQPPMASQTAKRGYWQCRFTDGSRVVLAVEARPAREITGLAGTRSSADCWRYGEDRSLLANRIQCMERKVARSNGTLLRKCCHHD